MPPRINGLNLDIVDEFRKGVRRSLKHEKTKEQLKRDAAAKAIKELHDERKAAAKAEADEK